MQEKLLFKFFIVLPLNLESLGLAELKEKHAFFLSDEPCQILSLVNGGIEIECSLRMGFSLNYILRTPTRILLRITEFKCRDFPKLFNKISKLNWSQWMIGQNPEVLASSKNSRMFDSRKIEKAIQDGILSSYRHRPIKKKYLDKLIDSNKDLLPKIYFRVVDDNCTLSIDTTGERLHLRGEKKLNALAPIRENLAALLLIELNQYIIDFPYTLIDPMCGSGTFLYESLSTYSISMNRDFSFNYLPIFMEDKILLPKLQSSKNLRVQTHIGFDINADVVKLAKQNIGNLEIFIEDLFFSKKQQRENSIVIVNPPYGIRIGSNINSDYYIKIITAIRNKFSPKLLAIIIPIEFSFNPSEKEFSILSKKFFQNGGIDVCFYVVELK